MGDLPDVTGVQVDGDRKAIPKLVEFRRIVGGSLDDFAQCLLAGRRYPNLPGSEFFEIPGDAVEIEDQFTAGRHVLPRLIDKEEDVLTTRLSTAQFDDLSCKIADVTRFFEAQVSEAFRCREIIRQHRRDDLRRPGHSDQGVVVDLFPFPLETLSVFRFELIVFSATIKGEFQLSGLLFFRKARPLEHLPI